MDSRFRGNDGQKIGRSQKGPASYEQVDHRLAICVPNRGFSNRAAIILSKGDAVQK